MDVIDYIIYEAHTHAREEGRPLERIILTPEQYSELQVDPRVCMNGVVYPGAFYFWTNAGRVEIICGP